MPLRFPTHARLRRILHIDGIISGATGLLLFLAADLLAGVFGLPDALLRGAGLVLVPFSGGVLWIARQEPLWEAAALGVVAGNVAWVLASMAALIGGWFQPEILGYGFVMAQAAIVAGLADLQYRALRAGRRSPA